MASFMGFFAAFFLLQVVISEENCAMYDVCGKRSDGGSSELRLWFSLCGGNSISCRLPSMLEELSESVLRAIMLSKSESLYQCEFRLQGIRTEEQAAGIMFFWILGMRLVSLIQRFMLDQETRYCLDGMSSDAGKFISSTVDDFIANFWGLIWDFNDFNCTAFIAHCAALAWALIQLVWGMRLIIRGFFCWTWVFVCYLFDVKFAAVVYFGYRLTSEANGYILVKASFLSFLFF
ncbi:hypothetical protein M0R45_010372 [Rubus argutus]|uniref:Uncharacterized protein n=1 Tax=Rubus argutus TaxID=59490 RepID=A0AAW1Y7L0_RUBAR